MDKQRTTSFSLGDHYGKFLEGLVGSGRYGSASEVVREALRLLEQRVEFESFIKDLPPDDEEFIDPEAFAREMAERRKGPFVSHEEAMVTLGIDER